MRWLLVALLVVMLLSGCGGAEAGQEGGACHPDDSCADDALVCGPDGLCHACGRAGQYCCHDATCREWYRCDDDERCHACGRVGSPCCKQDRCCDGCACGLDGLCHPVASDDLDPADCDSIADWCDRADCVARGAVASGDMTLCDRFLLMRSDYCPYYECVDYVAEWTVDVALCHDISVLEVSEWCVGTVAGATGNAALCEQLAGRNAIDHCLAQVAQSTGDKSLCEGIVLEYWRGSCYD